MNGLPGALARLVGDRRFQSVVIAVILANAVILGLETFEQIDSRVGDELRLLDWLCLAFFCVEIALRIGAHGRRPQAFFTRPGNVFDFTVTVAALMPALGGSAALLRMVRVLRVARLLAAVPDLRVVVRGLVRSLMPIGAVALLTLLVLYLYGMLGWILFGDQDPENWGNLAQAMLTLFAVLTLEGWVEVMDRAVDITPLAYPYFISFVLIGGFVILNIVIAVVLNSVEEARADQEPPEAPGHDDEHLRTRIAELRDALDALERDLPTGSSSRI